jgi:hypothetical protein
MSGRTIVQISAICGVVLSTAVAAKPMPDTGPPAVVRELFACRAITDTTQRLACYDKQTNLIEQALGKRDVVMIDKEKATAAKKSLFGFSTPSLAGMFGGGDDVKSIESKVTSVTKNADGGWIVKLEDGSVWSQTDDAMLGLPPARGDKVKITRGFGGSYFLQLGKQSGYRARRIG